MRQDLSLFQAKVEDKFDITGQCEDLMTTIDTRQKRLELFTTNREPLTEDFLTDII